ncbi:endothelin-converting enzyme 1-like isoform X1 [Rhipicephalus microplus]|uniref:endothelin-converting enzyme 1-like isoform X1 n=1 Tax=Rhipicephalus microplus TaxID=6941 RepID=UPI003F6CBDBF
MKSGTASNPASQASASGQVSLRDEDVCRERHSDGCACTKRHSVPQSIELHDALFETSNEGLLPSSEMAPIFEYYPSTVQREFTSAETPVAGSGVSYCMTKSQISGPIRRLIVERHDHRFRNLLIAFCLAVLASAIVVSACVALYIFKRVPVRLLTECTSQACLQHEALVSSLLNASVAPCEDFYTHVCGSWSSDPGKLSVSDKALTTYQRRLSRQALLQPVPASGQTPKQKATKMFAACYNVVDKKVSYVESIRKVMVEAGLPWPHVDSHTDILHSIFAMSTWPIPVLFRIAFTNSVSGGGHLIIRSITLGVFAEHIWREKDEEQREEYFHVFKEYFKNEKYRRSITYNETVSLEKSVIPELGKSLIGTPKILRTHTSELNKMAPSIPLEAWQRELKRRFNTSSANVTIYGIRFFEVFFELHSTLGERVLKEYYGWFVAEAFLPYTNAHILREFHGGDERAMDEQIKFCLGFSGVTRYALDANYLKSTSDKKVLEQATQAGARLKDAFHETVRRNSWFQESLATSPEVDRAEILLGTLSKSGEKEWLPDMTDDAIRNLAALSSLSLVSGTTENAPSSSSEKDQPKNSSLVPEEVANPPLTLAPYHFSFPFLMVDAPAYAIYAGVGSVLARLLFQHFFAAQQRWKRTTLEKLHEQMGCVYTADETIVLDQATRDDVVVATAATSTLWHAFLSAASPTGSNVSSPATDLDSQLPKLSERQLFFLILCHSTCGDPAGPMRCNVPLRNSKAFVETFSCQPGTPMHATHMCPVFR